MKQDTLLFRTLIAAAALSAASAAHAVSVGGTLDAATQVVADTGLTGNVKLKLASDARLKGSDISVNTENNVVVLTGTAPSAEAKAAATDVAKASVGADVKIDNRIETPSVVGTVKAEVKEGAKATGEVVTDAWITTKLKSQLIADTTTKGTAIKVTTRDNVVFLRGTVQSQAEKDQAVALAQQTKGVAKVNASALKVKASAKADASTSMQ
jgi:hyperosmotically inducible protein